MERKPLENFQARFWNNISCIKASSPQKLSLAVTELLREVQRYLQAAMGLLCCSSFFQHANTHSYLHHCLGGNCDASESNSLAILKCLLLVPFFFLPLPSPSGSVIILCLSNSRVQPFQLDEWKFIEKESSPIINISCQPKAENANWHDSTSGSWQKCQVCSSWCVWTGLSIFTNPYQFGKVSITKHMPMVAFREAGRRRRRR